MSVSFKSAVFDFADGWGGTEIGLRQIDFIVDGSSVSLYGLYPISFLVYSTSEFSGDYEDGNAFNEYTSKTMEAIWNSWKGSSNTNQRLTITFSDEVTMDGVEINNFHSEGGATTTGVKNTEIYLSSDSVTSTVYGESVPNSVKVFDGTVDEHVSSDVEDPQSINFPVQITSETPTITSVSSVAVPGAFVKNVLIETPSSNGLSVVLPNASNITNIKNELQIISDYSTVLLGNISVGRDTPTATSESIILPQFVNRTVLSPIFDSISTPYSGAVQYITASMPVISSFSTPSVGTICFFSTSTAIIRYLFVVDGGNDGLDDVTIPISSFQARRRSGDPTYLSVVIPTYDYADEITDRANGDMVVYQAFEFGGEIKQREEIIRTDIEEIRYDVGGASKSVILTGYKQQTFSPKTVEVFGLTYKSLVSGKRHYRLAAPEIFLNPGDTVSIDGESITVGIMSYAISAMTQQIEIEEA